MAIAWWPITAKPPGRRSSTFIFICWAGGTSAGRPASAASCRWRHAEPCPAERHRATGLAAGDLATRQEVFLRLAQRGRNVRCAGGERRLTIARERRSAGDDHQVGELLADDVD